jgi:hypothetical protein
VEITFISSLDSEEEDRLAPAIVSAVSAILDDTSFAYTIRVRTTGLKVFAHSHPSFRSAGAADGLPRAVASQGRLLQSE